MNGLQTAVSLEFKVQDSKFQVLNTDYTDFYINCRQLSVCLFINHSSFHRISFPQLQHQLS